MKNLSRPLVITASIALGLLGGVALRMWLHPAVTTATAPTTSAPAATGTSSQTTVAKGKLNLTSSLADKLQQDLALSGGVERWLHWVAAIENAGLEDLPDLARLTRNTPAAQRLLAARWIELNPQHLFNTLNAANAQEQGLPVGELASLLFAEWPKRDPQAVRAALSQPSTLANSYRHRAVEVFMEQDPELGITVMSEWHISDYYPGTDGIVKWATANPQHAIEFTLAHPAGQFTQSIMETIGKSWGQSDPAAAMDFISKSTAVGKSANGFSAAVLKLWADNDLTAAGGWLAAADESTRDRLSPSFVESWAAKDPTAALAWCQQSLEGTAQDQAITGLIKGMAAKDIPAAAALVTALPPSPIRTTASIAMMHAWFLNSSGDTPAPPAAIAWFSSLDPDSITKALENEGWRWGYSDPQSLSEFLKTPAGAHAPLNLINSLARNLVAKDPAAALTWADQLPTAQQPAAQRAVFEQWQQNQPAAALHWLTQLPTTDTRRQPLLDAAILNLISSSDGPAQLAQSLPTADHPHARQFLSTLPIPEDKRTALLKALDSP